MVPGMFVGLLCTLFAVGSAATANWRVVSIHPMGVPRAAHQATKLADGDVLITGGCTGPHCGQVLTSAEIYHPASRSFRPVAAMRKARASHAAVRLADGRILVVGGWDGERATTSAEIYDPATKAWRATGALHTGRASPIAVVLDDGRVLAMGGGQGGVPSLATAEIYDPARGRFSRPLAMGSNHYLATRLADGRVLLTGGKRSGGRILATAAIFDPTKGSVRPTGSMGVPRVKQGAALLADGRVLIIGGSNGHSYRGRYTSSEIYDPTRGTFSPGPAMHWPRHKIRDAIVALPSGEVLVAGGAIHPEIYDPKGNDFKAIDGTIGGPQMFATATLLDDGDVLVVGGYDDHTQPSASAWLITQRPPKERRVGTASE